MSKTLTCQLKGPRDLAILREEPRSAWCGARTYPWHKEMMGTGLETLKQRQSGKPSGAHHEDGALSTLVSQPCQALTADDLRQLISQGAALEQLVPQALVMLSEDPLLRADLFPGDLLEAMKTISEEYWASHAEERLTWNRIRCQHARDDD